MCDLDSTTQRKNLETIYGRILRGEGHESQIVRGWSTGAQSRKLSDPGELQWLQGVHDARLMLIHPVNTARVDLISSGFPHPTHGMTLLLRAIATRYELGTDQVSLTSLHPTRDYAQSLSPVDHPLPVWTTTPLPDLQQPLFSLHVLCPPVQSSWGPDRDKRGDLLSYLRYFSASDDAILLVNGQLAGRIISIPETRSVE